MKACVLFNPRAGSAGQIDALRAALAAEPGVEVRELARGDDLAALAAEAARDHPLVAVAGGDGTAHAAANGLLRAGAPAALAVLPLGTGNDFCRTLAVPLDPVAAAGLLRTGVVRRLDAVKLGGDRTGFLVNAATGGFSGKVAADVTPELKAFWGPLAYLRGAAGTIVDPPRYHLTVRLDGGPPERFDALNVVIANCRTAAGGMAVAPTADPEDGLLDVVIVRSGGTLDLSVVAVRLMHGDYLGDENVVHRLARAVELTSDPPLPLSVDGERCEGARFTFEVVPRALRVLTGPDYHASPAADPPLEHDEDEFAADAPAAPAAAAKGIGARLFGLVGGVLLLAKRAPRAYLAGLGAAAVAIVLFAWLARGVVGAEWRAWDERVGAAVRGTTADLTRAAVAVTRVGDAAPFAGLVAVALAALLARRRYVDAAALLAVVVGLLAMEAVLKPLFAVARPVLAEPRHFARGFSFPSGHALRTVGVLGYLGGVAALGFRRAWWRLPAAAGCAGLAAGVCWSRVYLGVHHPTDVIAGALAAAAWAVACLIGRHYAMTRPRPGAGYPAVGSGTRSP